MKFQTEQLNYLQRLRKEFLFGFLILSVMILYFHFKSSSSVEFTATLIGVIGFGLVLAAHSNAQTYFYEVEISDGSLTIRGDSSNRPLTIEMPISETNIYVKSKGKGGGNEYFIRFEHGDETYDINRLFNWNYTTLIELFHEFKNQKNEKVIWDEKYLLEFMEKKARGMSSFQIAFGKDKKDQS